MCFDDGRHHRAYPRSVDSQGASSVDALAERAIQKRCRGTAGTWCGKYDRQEPSDLKPPPRGDRPCKNDCNGVGNCNYDTGLCDCPAGGADPSMQTDIISHPVMCDCRAAVHAMHPMQPTEPGAMQQHAGPCRSTQALHHV
jgi:hypothetical protein